MSTAESSSAPFLPPFPPAAAAASDSPADGTAAGSGSGSVEMKPLGASAHTPFQLLLERARTLAAWP
jgi:hypothetical protein